MKQLTALLLIFSLLLSLAGCSGVSRALDRAEDRVEEKLDTVEDSVERSVRKTLIPESAALPEESFFNPVTKEKAEQIALDHLGFTADQVEHLRTEYEIDDGIPQYDVEFHQGDWEYEFEIHAETGKILSCDRDSKYN